MRLIPRFGTQRPGAGSSVPAASVRPGRVLDLRTRRLVWLIAIGADVLQIVLFPFFIEGGASAANDALDVMVAIAMVRLLGWHPALLPTLIAELIPGLDLVPTWTVAAWLALRGHTEPPPR